MTEGLIQLLGRVLLALIFILAGIGKYYDQAGTIAYMQTVGLSGLFLWPTILLEVGGGLAIALGYKTQFAAFTLAGFSILAALLFHLDLADKMQVILFLKNLAMAGGLLILATSPRTAFSLESPKSYFG